MTQTGVLRWMFGHITDLCQATNTQRFTCNGAKVVYNASLVWGTIGPQRMFQAGQTYNGLMYFFLIGVSIPHNLGDNKRSDLFAACRYCTGVSHLPTLPQ